MTSPVQQYTDLVTSSQQAALKAVDTWTKAVRDAAGHLPSPTAAGQDTTQVIDQVFDFAAKLLEAQRSFAKQVIASSANAAEEVTKRAEQTEQGYVPQP